MTEFKTVTIAGSEKFTNFTDQTGLISLEKYSKQA
jgi:hypothetical protein